MSKKSIWTQQEDQFLKQLICQQKKRDWDNISKAIFEKFKRYQFSPKQSLQRLHHFSVSPSANLNLGKWTDEEVRKMVNLYEIWGSKWSKIALILKSRDENNIKNKFYSGVRKLVRRFNTALKENQGKNTLNYAIIIDILNSRPHPSADIEFKRSSEQLRHKIIGLFTQQMIDKQKLIDLAHKIIKASLLTKSTYTKDTENNNKIAPIIEDQIKKYFQEKSQQYQLITEQKNGYDGKKGHNTMQRQVPLIADLQDGEQLNNSKIYKKQRNNNSGSYGFTIQQMKIIEAKDESLSIDFLGIQWQSIQSPLFLSDLF